MIHSLAINAVVSLVIGLTLLWLWRRHDAPLFARDLGLAYVVQLAIPLGYLGVLQGGAAAAVGRVAWYAGSVGYQTLMVAGTLRLAGCVPGRRLLAGLVLAMAVLNGGALWADRTLQVQLFHACLTVGMGLVFTRWLWRHRWPERAVGLMVAALGVNQLTSVVGGEAALATQAAVATVLRLALGLAVLIAARSLP